MQHTEDFSEKSSSKKHTVFYFSYDGLLDPVGRSQILPYLLELQHHFDFLLVSYEKDTDGFEFHEMKSFLAKTSIRWYPLKFHQKIRFISSIINIIEGKKLLKKIFSSYTISIAHARSYLPAWLLLNFAKKYKVPLVFDMRGFWVDERIDGNIWKKNIFTKILYHYFKKIEQKLIHNAAHIISLTKAASQWMENNWNIITNKITVIPCCTRYDMFNPESVQVSLLREIRERYSIPENAYVLGYIGSTGTWYLVDEMLAFFKALKIVRPDAFFLMIVNYINSQKKEEILSEKSVTILERVSYEDIPLYLSLMDAVIMFIKPAFSKIASSPIKMAEAFAMNKPVIINQGIGDTHLVEKLKLGIIVDQFTTTAYKKAIRELLVLQPHHIRNSSRPVFDVINGSKEYLKVYESILHQSK